MDIDRTLSTSREILKNVGFFSTERTNENNLKKISMIKNLYLKMELREPKRKKRVRLEPKSSLPLVFGNKGEITKFHANLTALGSCIADPTEMEMIFKMGYFGKGSLSKSHPLFGRVRYGAPPIIRNRQWQRRQVWISEVQKLSRESFFDNENNQSKTIDKISTHRKDRSDNAENINKKYKDLNAAEFINNIHKSNILTDSEFYINKERLTNDIEILDNEINNSQINDQNNQINIKVDEVVIDSTEEEDISEISADNYQSNNFDKNNLFNKYEKIQIINRYIKEDSDLQEKVLVLPDSDSDTENYLIDIKPEIKHENFPVRETLHLTFEETFFLMYGLGCLRVIDFDGKYLNIEETWDYFCKVQKCFVQKYVTYHYFRSKGWVVKPGLKYGGDFLLYKEGPPFYHSSYIVIIDVLDAVTLKRIENKSVRNMTWNKFIGLERLAEAVGKEVLFAQVLWPSSVSVDILPTSPDILAQFTVRELLWRRWKLSQDTSSINIDDDDEDGYSS